MSCRKKKCNEDIVLPYIPYNQPPIVAYGGLQSIYKSSLTLVKDTITIVNTPSELPKHNVIYATNEIEIKTKGTYELEYVLLASSSDSCLLTATLSANNEPLSSTSMGRNVLSNYQYLFTGTSLVNLNKGDKIGLYVYSSVNTTLTLPDGLNGEIILKKVSKN